MDTLLLNTLQELIEIAWAGVGIGFRGGVARGRVLPDVGLGIRVVFVVVEGGGHIHDLTHGGAAKRRVTQLRHVVTDQLGVIQRAFSYQNLRHRPDEGFGDRHGTMAAFRIQAT